MNIITALSNSNVSNKLVSYMIYLIIDGTLLHYQVLVLNIEHWLYLVYSQK